MADALPLWRRLPPVPIVGGRPNRVNRAGQQWVAVLAAVLCRPHLWPEAARQAWRLARPGGRAWLRFRLVTAYGRSDQPPPPRDVVAWLEWSRRTVHGISVRHR